MEWISDLIKGLESNKKAFQPLLSSHRVRIGEIHTKV